MTKFPEENLGTVHFRILGYTSECLIKMNNSFKNSAGTFAKKRSLTLKTKFKTSSGIIHQGFNLIDNETDCCCFEQLNWFFNELSYSSEISETSIKYVGVYQLFDQFFGAFI